MLGLVVSKMKDERSARHEEKIRGSLCFSHFIEVVCLRSKSKFTEGKSNEWVMVLKVSSLIATFSGSKTVSIDCSPVILLFKSSLLRRGSPCQPLLVSFFFLFCELVKRPRNY